MYYDYNVGIYRGQEMTERQTLECMLDIADSQYHNTGDKWWLQIGVEIARKLRSKNYVAKDI